MSTVCITEYASPLGRLLLAGDETALTGLWFVGQAHFPAALAETGVRRTLPVLAQTANWLDLYFCGEVPDFMPPLRPAGTPFRQTVWTALQAIPYGETVSYGALAQQLAAA